MRHMMQRIVVLLFLLSVCSGVAGTLEDVSYGSVFNRAAALLPGRTSVQRELAQDQDWTVTGAARAEAGAGLSVLADRATVEFVWKGTFPEARGTPIRVDLGVSTEVPVRVRFYGFADGRYRRVGDWRPVDAASEDRLRVMVHRPPSRRYGDPDAGQFRGFKIVINGKDLAGTDLVLQDVRLTAAYHEGCFRHSVEVPEGTVWEAVAEVATGDILYVNGKRVEDETVILPRPMTGGAGSMYKSRRVPLKPHIEPGRNVLGIYRRIGTRAVAPAYLRGSVVMVSGERVLLDTDTNWVWQAEVDEDWFAPDYDDSDWWPIIPIEETPRSDGRSYDYHGERCVAAPISTLALSYRPRGKMPCYDGVIKLRHPHDNKLYFNETQPVQLQALIPGGLLESRPEWSWEISRYQEGGTFEPVAQGRVTAFERETDSLVGAMESVRLPRGVYALTGRLHVNGELLEERTPEPMVVTGKVKMDTTEGDALEQGLDMVLETVVNFTDPDDPHPWFETDGRAPIPGGVWSSNYYHTVEEPLVVERHGLTYRVTRPVNRAQFSYKVGFKHPGDWYLLVLEYPDDTERWIGVSCNADRVPSHLRRRSPERRYSACSKCGPAIWTGGKYPNTGKMLEMKWIFRPDPGSHSINVMSLMKGTEAAAARLRIYHIAGRLPELDAGDLPVQRQRRFGMLTERTHPWANGIYNLFSSIDSRMTAENPVPLSGSRGAGQYSRNPIVDGCEHLRLLEDAASRFAEYMRFAGQNLHTMGCFQYSDSNTASQYITGSPRIHDSSENMLGRVLAANDLQFYASVEFISTDTLGEEVQPEYFLVDRHGEPAAQLWASKPLNLNFLQPAVEQEMVEVSRQLAEKFRHVPTFLGINWTTYFEGFWIPTYRAYSYPPDPDMDPLSYGYDDLTVQLFEKETGIKVPVPADAGDRFEKRYQFLTSEAMKARWIAWRSRKMAEFFVKVNRVIRRVRPDLETVAGCYLNYNHVAEWKSRDISFSEYLASWGWAPEAFKNKDNVWLMPWLPLAARYQPAARTMGYAMGWQGNKDPDFYAAFDDLERRAMMLHAGWIEVERIAGNFPAREGWPRPYQQTMMAQQREEMAMEPYTQAMIGFDPQMIMMGFTDVSPYVGVEDTQRKFTRVLRRLPWGRFDPVLDTGFDTDMAIRALRNREGYWFYVANPGYWPVSGTVTVEGADRVTDLVSGKQVSMDQGAVAVDLEPFGIAAFKAEVQGNPESEIRVSAWTTAPPPESELEHMANILEQAQAALARQGNVAGFLGPDDYQALKGGVEKAEQAMAGERYAAAWSALTDARFWTVLFQKMPGMPEEVVSQRELAVMRIGGGYAPRADGVLDDRMWREPTRMAEAAGPFIGENKQYPVARTMAHVGWPGSRLCFAFECQDPEPGHVRSTVTEDGKAQMWESGDDMVVLTLMPDDEHAYQFAVNAGGVQSARCILGADKENFDPEWQAAVKTYDWGWVAEILLHPREAFGAIIRANKEWQVNFHRLFRQNLQPPASWTYTPDWQTTKNMGVLKFVPYQR